MAVMIDRTSSTGRFAAPTGMFPTGKSYWFGAISIDDVHAEPGLTATGASGNGPAHCVIHCSRSMFDAYTWRKPVRAPFHPPAYMADTGGSVPGGNCRSTLPV